MLRAALETRTQIIWDLFHYGWPDWLDLFKPKFIDAFAKYARAFARLWREAGAEVRGSSDQDVCHGGGRIGGDPLRREHPVRNQHQ